MKISLEFFPPKTDEQHAVLARALPKLQAVNPEYVSVTFGAGGSTLSYTPETVRVLKQTWGFDAAPHISCMGGSREEIRQLLKLYQAMGCKRLVALRGDMPSGMAGFGDFRYANELVEFIRAETGTEFHIQVGCYPETHPQAGDAFADLKNLKRKIDAGADGAITQYFFNTDAYFRLSMTRGASASPKRSSPASCRSAILRSSSAFPKSVAPKSRAGSTNACAAWATTATPFVSWAPTWWRRSAAA